MALTISCAFAPAAGTPEHVKLAEQLGYQRAWLYDSPALYHDVFMTLARSADRTTTIGLGTGVMIPSLRHPMDAAASIASLVGLAPGRVAIGTRASPRSPSSPPGPTSRGSSLRSMTPSKVCRGAAP